METTRRDGYYDIACDGELFRVERHLASDGWQWRWYLGREWSQYFRGARTLREAKREIADSRGMMGA